MGGATHGRRRCADLDSCWAVPVAAACIAFLACVATSSYGYLYVLFMQKHQLRREEAAWPHSALVISGGCVGLLVSVLQKKFSLYHITLIGGFVASAGVLASSFAPNIAWLSATFGVIQGAGMGTALLGVAMYLLLYFHKYKATATAVKDVGTVAAGVAGVPWTSLLVREYGLQGSLLLTGALMLHILPIVMLIRTPRPFQICRRSEKDDITGSSQHADTEPVPTVTRVTPLLKDEEPFEPSPCTERQVSSRCCPIVRFVFKLFPFFVLVGMQVVSNYSFGTFMTTIVDYAADKGTELERAKTVIMFTALGQALGRVVVPLASDKISFSRSPIAIICLLATAACFLAITRVTAFEEVAALAGVAGLGLGYIICMQPLLVADHVGLEWFSLCCGMGGPISVPLVLSGPAILGFFRDKRGSYDRLYFVLAGLNLTVAILLTALVLQVIIQRRRSYSKHASSAIKLETKEMKETTFL